jgi:hypothetical protein
MITITNKRPGILIIPDAGIKLLPGESVPVEVRTDQIKHALQQKLIKRSEEESEPEAVAHAVEAVDLSSMNATEAIAEVNQMDDPALLQGYLTTEKRKTVLDALGDRLAEIGSGSAPD